MVRSKEDIDNFMVEITTLSRKYGIAVHGFDGGAFLTDSENMAQELCKDGDFWWNEKDQKYEIKNSKYS